MKYTEIQTKSALHKLKTHRLPYNYDVNVYRGCIHRCQYCYAIYSHQYLEADNRFFDKIFVKANIAENLERELSSSQWKGEVINFGGVCDSYQAIEAKYGIMRDILKILIKYEQPMIISTKSDLILRDIDLISKLAEKVYVNVAVTITSTDKDIYSKVEPFAPIPEKRFNVLKEFRNTKVNTGLHTMPILPFLTDSKENFEDIFSKTRDIGGVDYVLSGMLNLIGQTKQHFLHFISQSFPQYYDKYLNMYRNWQGSEEYRKKLYPMIYLLKAKYGLTGSYSDPIKKRFKSKKQQKLF